MLHNLCSWTDKALDIADCFKFIADKKEVGQIKNIGISMHDNSKYQEKSLKEHPK